MSASSEYVTSVTKAGVTVSLSVSAVDGAPVVQIDTTFEPDYNAFRVHLNDFTLHEGSTP